MSENPEFPTPAEDPGTPESVPPEPERVRTGVAKVDEVITAVEELEDRPLEEHVGTFETAHEQLRRALDHAGDDHAGDDHAGDGPAGEAARDTPV